ncbi:MAG: hypothetical protein ACLP0J_04995 [Solirubrobacteraceae bacterium]
MDNRALPLRTRPAATITTLDDATLSRSERVFGEDLEWIEVYERQLACWQALPLTAEQREEVRRLAGELAPWRAIVQMTLELVAELLSTERSTRSCAPMTRSSALRVLLGLRPLP